MQLDSHLGLPKSGSWLLPGDGASGKLVCRKQIALHSRPVHGVLQIPSARIVF